MSTTLEQGTQEQPGFGAALASELIKVRNNRSLWVLLLVTLLLCVGITALVAGFGGAESMFERQSDGAAGSRFEVMYFGSYLGVWAYAFFAAQFVAAEFSSGLITYTLTATPRRSRVLLAKLAIVVGIGLVAGVAISMINFIITQGVVMAAGYPGLALADDGLLRVLLVFLPVQMAFWAGAAMLAAAAVRTAAPTVIVLFVGSMLPVVSAGLLPPAFGETIPRWMPGAVIESLSGLAVPGTAGYLPLPAATIAILVWSAAFVAVGLAAFRRDV